MLKRLYVDNFRCLVNFEMKFDRLGLFMGENGAGKSTVFEVLRRLRSFLLGYENVEGSFPAEALTRWQQAATQRFELDVEIESKEYTYSLVVEHDEARQQRTMQHEQLLEGIRPVYTFEDGQGKMYEKDGSSVLCAFDPRRSAVSVHGIGPIDNFSRAVSRWLLLRLVPANIQLRSDRELRSLSEDGANFPSWYRYALNEYLRNMPGLFEHLKDVLPGFDSFTLREAGESKLLKARFSTGGQSCEYGFHELSDGQRALIVLYTIVLGLRGQGYSLFLDEPDNWLSLHEIQPWLRTLHDACTKDIEQAVIISHHPGIIDYLGPSMGHWFDRQENGAVLVSDKAPEDAGDLRLSEIIARGWHQ